MAERVVSVKMPASLVQGLDSLRERHHYLDLSEQLRSIVRQKGLALTNPHAEELDRMRSDFAERMTAQTAREQVLHDLIRMLKEGER